MSCWQRYSHLPPYHLRCSTPVPAANRPRLSRLVSMLQVFYCPFDDCGGVCVCSTCTFVARQLDVPLNVSLWQGGRMRDWMWRGWPARLTVCTVRKIVPPMVRGWQLRAWLWQWQGGQLCDYVMRGGLFARHGRQLRDWKIAILCMSVPLYKELIKRLFLS